MMVKIGGDGMHPYRRTPRDGRPSNYQLGGMEK